MDLHPSWRLLRNTRRLLRDLGRNRELVAVITKVSASHIPIVRRAAREALLIYGQHAYRDSLGLACTDIAEAEQSYVSNVAMYLALAGDTLGVELAICAYPTSAYRGALLDALYYQSTPRAIEFVTAVARDDSDPRHMRRAKWMLSNPMPVERSWRF